MHSRLTRRAFTSFAIGSFFGCDDIERTKVSSPEPSHRATAALPEPSSQPHRAPPERVIPLFRFYPGLASRISHIPLGVFPTPIEHASKLGDRIGIPNLWIKRDDLSGEIYGGGKTRKLEFYLAHARANGSREIVTFGGFGSNQAVATALWGKAAGFSVRLMLAPQMPSAHVEKNLFAMRRAGAVIQVVRDGVGAAEIRAKTQGLRAKAPAPYLIPPGGSSPLGNMAFVNAALELNDQVLSGRCPMPDCIYLAMGTMGSAVGIAMGLELLGLKPIVVAVRASSPETSSESAFFRLAKETVAFARSIDPTFPDLRIGRARVRFVTNHLGGGYGFPTRAGASAMTLVEQAQGYSLEPTYTAKAMAALVDEAKRLTGKTVLFWNSHSTRPLLTDGVRPEDFPRELQEYLRKD
jgi:1-aminocyclopropane-1-carboxylate deaminase/D-cysteine desulfhydrase-like pyridoxal-dependent ACC family enzyme